MLWFHLTVTTISRPLIINMISTVCLCYLVNNIRSQTTFCGDFHNSQLSGKGIIDHYWALKMKCPRWYDSSWVAASISNQESIINRYKFHSSIYLFSLLLEKLGDIPFGCHFSSHSSCHPIFMDGKSAISVVICLLTLITTERGMLGMLADDICQSCSLIHFRIFAGSKNIFYMNDI